MIDNTVIENARNGDNLAFLQVHKSVEGLVYSTIKKSGLNVNDETKQAGYIATWETVKRYDSTKKVAFSTYFYWWLKKELREIIKKPSLPYITVDNEDLECITNKTISNERIENLDSISRRDHEIVRMKIEGYRLREISSKFSLSKERIRQIANNSLRRFVL